MIQYNSMQYDTTPLLILRAKLAGRRGAHDPRQRADVSGLEEYDALTATAVSACPAGLLWAEEWGC